VYDNRGNRQKCDYGDKWSGVEIEYIIGVEYETCIDKQSLSVYIRRVHWSEL
jgi:hypothetical protein